MQAACSFRINYSTAKTLLRQYKFNMFPYSLILSTGEIAPAPVGERPAVQCGYINLAEWVKVKLEAA
jgi:hypothetical protein